MIIHKECETKCEYGTRNVRKTEYVQLGPLHHYKAIK